MSTASVFGGSHRRIFARLGDDAIYQHGTDDAISVRVIVDHQIIGADGYPTVSENQVYIDFLLEQLAAPREGALLIVGGVTYKLAARQTGDQFRQRWVCRRVLT